MIRGVALALAQMPAMTAPYGSASKDEMGDATTLVNIVQRVGGAFGAIGIVIIVAQSAEGNRIDDFVWVFWALVVVSTLTLVCAAILNRHANARNAPSNRYDTDCDC